jgi:hypothetical protein
VSRRVAGLILGVATAAVLVSVTPGFVAAQEESEAYKPRSGCPEDVGMDFHRCAQEKMRTFKPPRTADARPDFHGYWSRVLQSSTIEERGPTLPEPRRERMSRASTIVDPPDGMIPYQPWAREQAHWNHDTYIDTQSQCYLPGPQRVPYTSPGGYQILQPRGDRELVLLVERVHMYHSIPLDGRSHIPANIKLFEGDPVGRWEGHTLVIDITNLNGETWFDEAGDFLSDAAHIVERMTLMDQNVIHVETTIEDPKVLTRPMKQAFALVRIRDPKHELLEDACFEGERDLRTINKFSNRYPGWKGLPGPHARRHAVPVEH